MEKKFTLFRKKKKLTHSYWRAPALNSHSLFPVSLSNAIIIPFATSGVLFGVPNSQPVTLSYGQQVMAASRIDTDVEKYHLWIEIEYSDTDTYTKEP